MHDTDECSVWMEIVARDEQLMRRMRLLTVMLMMMLMLMAAFLPLTCMLDIVRQRPIHI